MNESYQTTNTLDVFSHSRKRVRSRVLIWERVVFLNIVLIQLGSISTEEQKFNQWLRKINFNFNALNRKFWACCIKGDG